MVTSLRMTKVHILRASACPVQVPAEVERLDYLQESWDLDVSSWGWLRREPLTWTSSPW